jgi:hypothetical protein
MTLRRISAVAPRPATPSKAPHPQCHSHPRMSAEPRQQCLDAAAARWVAGTGDAAREDPAWMASLRHGPAAGRSDGDQNQSAREPGVRAERIDRGKHGAPHRKRPELRSGDPLLRGRGLVSNPGQGDIVGRCRAGEVGRRCALPELQRPPVLAACGGAPQRAAQAGWLRPLQGRAPIPDAGINSR